MKLSRMLVVLCLLALCASPLLAETTREQAEPDPLMELFFEASGSEGAGNDSAFSSSEHFEMEQGGCSNEQIRSAQNWCSQKAGAMTLQGHGDCTSKGIHYCYADSEGNVTDYSCAITCK